MIDLHCHILPGLDDGAPDLETALAMAAIAAADGTTDIMTTPHFLAEDVSARAGFAPALARLAAEIDSRGLPLRLHQGAEVMLDPELPDLAHQRALPTLGGGPYVLVELPFYSLPNYAENVLFALQTEGLRPIIAHPERCSPLQRDPEPLVRLIERGMLLQINADSLLGHHGKGAQQSAVAMLRLGMVHILASDAHSASERPPVLSEGVSQAAEVVGEPAARAMVTTVPAAVLSGVTITPGPFIVRNLERQTRRRWRFPFGR